MRAAQLLGLWLIDARRAVTRPSVSRGHPAGMAPAGSSKKGSWIALLDGSTPPTAPPENAQTSESATQKDEASRLWDSLAASATGLLGFKA